jgi:hypothetical protein
VNPRRLRSPIRWATYLAAVVCLGYLVSRFDSFRLAESGCSPLLRFAPGESLLLDRWAPSYSAGDALLFEGSDGLIYLGLVERVRPGAEPALWVVADNPDCEGRGSEEFGWIVGEARLARVVLKWPW